jgi:ADP-ribose pyrophosphatase YjhB (NUDIX family)
MKQKYEIFINSCPLIISRQSENDYPGIIKADISRRSDYRKIVSEIERQPDHPGILIVHPDIDEVFFRISKIFQWMQAAGGVVFNPENDLLLIYRYKKWDLPKGKMEENENAEETAVREVKEECGVSDIELIREIEKTYHAFKVGRKRILKETIWYEMICQDPQAIMPQIEESIEELKWMKKNEVIEAMQNTYPNVKALVEKIIHRIRE